MWPFWSKRLRQDDITHSAGLLRRPCDPKSIGCFRMAVDNGGGTIAKYDLKELWRRNKQGRIEGLRRRHIGFALQSGELLTSLTVRENIRGTAKP